MDAMRAWKTIGKFTQYHRLGNAAGKLLWHSGEIILSRWGSSSLQSWLVEMQSTLSPPDGDAIGCDPLRAYK